MKVPDKVDHQIYGFLGEDVVLEEVEVFVRPKISIDDHGLHRGPNQWAGKLVGHPRKIVQKVVQGGAVQLQFYEGVISVVQ